MHFTINSRKFAPVTFFAPNGGGYARIERQGMDGTERVQICYGGGFRGNAIRAADQESLEREARRWWRAYLATERQA